MAKITGRMLIAEFKRRKEGIIIGGVAGAVAAYIAIQQGADLTSLVEAGKGIIDSTLGRNAPAMDLAKYKLYAVFIFIGSAFGAIVDRIVDKM